MLDHLKVMRVSSAGGEECTISLMESLSGARGRRGVSPRSVVCHGSVLRLPSVSIGRMRRKRRSPIVAAYVLSLIVTIALLVVWVIYIVRSVARIHAMAGRVRVGGENSHWIVLGVGCALFFLLIAGLTWQLAQALAARRYSLKQEEFVSTVTHELKSPLAAIKLHAQTLQTPLTGEQQQRCVELVLQQADRMSSLVRDVL